MLVLFYKKLVVAFPTFALISKSYIGIKKKKQMQVYHRAYNYIPNNMDHKLEK